MSSPCLPRSWVRFLALTPWRVLLGLQFPPYSSPMISGLCGTVRTHKACQLPRRGPILASRVGRYKDSGSIAGMGTAQVPEQGTVSQGTGVPGAAGQEEPHLPQLHPLPSGAKSGCEKAHTKTNPVLREPCTVLGARALPHSHIRAGRFNWLCSPMNLLEVLDVGSPRGRGPCQQWQRKDVCAKWCISTTHAAPFIVPSLPSPAHPPGHPPSQPGLCKCFQTRVREQGASLPAPVGRKMGKQDPAWSAGAAQHPPLHRQLPQGGWDPAEGLGGRSWNTEPPTLGMG